MKTSSRWNVKFMVGKLMMGLVLAVIIGGINVVPSFGDDNQNRGGRQDNGRYEQRGRGNDNNRYKQKEQRKDRERYEQNRRVHRPRGYTEEVYAPSPIIYAPPRPPGIEIFFPPIILHP